MKEGEEIRESDNDDDDDDDDDNNGEDPVAQKLKVEDAKLGIDLSTFIIFKDLKSSGISLIQARTVFCKVRCLTCKIEINKIFYQFFENDSNILVNNTVCEKCHQKVQMFMRRVFIT